MTNGSETTCYRCLGCSNRERHYSRLKRCFCGSVCLALTGTGKKLRYIVILRETGFQNIPMKYFEILIWNIYSQITTKMAVTTSMAALYTPFCTDRYTTTSIFCFLRTFILKQTHMCVCYKISNNNLGYP